MESFRPLVTYIDDNEVEVVCPLGDADARVIVEGRPVRDFPVYRGRRSYSGLFWSATMGRHVAYESLLECSWLWLADFDPMITRIAAHPFCLQGLDGARTRTRYPDFLCLTSDGAPLVVDVKAPGAMADAKVSAALEWTQEVIQARGWRYEVWTGADPTVLRNVRFIAAGRRPGLDAEPAVSVFRPQDDSLTFAEVETRLRAQAGLPRLTVLAALWQGRLVCDLSLPLNPTTVLEVRST